MKLLTRLAALCLALLLVPAALCPAAASDQRGSVSVRITWSGQPVPGGTVTLYRVADLAEDLTFSPAPGFSDCGTDLNGALTASAAHALADYAAARSIPGETKSLTAEGFACFPDLMPGLYLLVQPSAGEGFEPFNPFLVSIPTVIDDAIYYDVEAGPKAAPTPTPPPDLPQTGQLRWPVPVLAFTGAALLLLGLLPERRKRREA